MRPSAGALETALAAMLPPAPLTLSTTSGTASRRPSFSPITRATISVPPPGANPTTIRIDCERSPCASPAAGMSAIPIATNAIDTAWAIDFRCRRPSTFIPHSQSDVCSRCKPSEQAVPLLPARKFHYSEIRRRNPEFRKRQKEAPAWSKRNCRRIPHPALRNSSWPPDTTACPMRSGTKARAPF